MNSLNLQPEPWTIDALCAQADPDAWFPEKGQPSAPAKRICNGDEDREPCPVRDECLTYALDNDIRFGVFGGMSAHERITARQERKNRAA